MAMGAAMIKVKVRYPWGERFIKYSSWEYRVGEITDDIVVSSKVVSEKKATTQKEYQKLMDLFEKRKDDVIGTKSFKEYSGHYFEYTDLFGTRMYEMIIGFLA